MTQEKKDGSLEALVAADEGGCSGPPGGAQAPVADDTCDLRAKLERAENALSIARSNFRAWRVEMRWLEICVRDLRADIKASKTHVGGNGEVCDGGA
jgi:hypothetical protein